MKELIEKGLDPKEWEFEFQQRAEQTTLMCDTWCRALQYELANQLQLNVGNVDYIFTNNSNGYLKKAKKKEILDKLREAINSGGKLEYIYESTLKRVEELGKFVDEILDKMKNGIENKELVRIWKEFDSLFVKVIPWFYIPWYVTEENMITDKIKKDLKKYEDEISKITDMNNAIMLLVFPTKEAPFQKEQKDFLELLKTASEKKDFDQDLDFREKAERYLERYGWKKTYVFCPLEWMSMDGLIKNIREGFDNKFIEEYEDKEKQKIKNNEVLNRVSEIIKDDKELVENINWAREFAWLLTQSVEDALKFTGKLIPFYKLLAKKMGIEYKQWSLLTSEEIGKKILDNGFVSEKELQERDLGHFYWMENDNVNAIFGEEGKKASEEFIDSVGSIDEDIKELKGQSASPGKVKGLVKKASNARNSLSIREGDILVTSMTTPDYVPAMKKAGAILTDEGGLLCHAAIMSRELGKPCVIGTKIATKILKDGDLIEVDANKGVVKILEKA